MSTVIKRAGIQTVKRFYSQTKRVPLPTLTEIKRYLGQVNSTLKPADAHTILTRAAADQTNNTSTVDLYEEYTGAQLFDLKRVIEGWRNARGGGKSSELVQLENRLVEAAAEQGSNRAIAILAKSCLLDKTSSQEDKDHAQNLLKELVELEDPTALQCSAELALLSGNPGIAVNLYIKAGEAGLSNGQDSYDEEIVAPSAFEQAGVIRMGQFDPWGAREALNKAVLHRPQGSARAHYLLGKLAADSHDNNHAHSHLSAAAAQLHPEAMLELGYMELKLLNHPKLAQTWFQLLAELLPSDPRPFVGLIDVALGAGNSYTLNLYLELLKKRLPQDQYDEFRAIRQIDLDKVNASTQDTSSESRWN